ncbi:MAG: hypothetical protein H6545_07845 [Bacteroidales bacterium]|nr:hypothetical protein [Bacteroidales bacterium]
MLPARGNAVYTAGAADLAKGWVDLVLHAYATGMCPEHTDTMRLTFDPLPDIPVISVSAGANDFCDDDATSITLRSTPRPMAVIYGGGTVLPQVSPPRP